MSDHRAKLTTLLENAERHLGLSDLARDAAMSHQHPPVRSRVDADYALTQALEASLWCERIDLDDTEREAYLDRIEDVYQTVAEYRQWRWLASLPPGELREIAESGAPVGGLASVLWNRMREEVGRG